MIVRRSDEAIRNDVIRELDWDSRVDGTTMQVAVADRIVTLTGTARAYLEKVVAQQAAHRVPGVLDVVNDIVVLPSERPDTELAKAVRHALEWNVCVPDQRIASTVSMGCVTLEGTVDLLREREDAEEAVRGLRGVCSVRNEIVVDGRQADPSLIRAAIDGALARHALHEAKHITVSVDDGIVTLTGPVDSFAEKRAVMGLVSHMPGIRAVRDRLMLPS
jgi:osmotically-inducible protein OsmY